MVVVCAVLVTIVFSTLDDVEELVCDAVELVATFWVAGCESLNSL